MQQAANGARMEAGRAGGGEGGGELLILRAIAIGVSQ